MYAFMARAMVNKYTYIIINALTFFLHMLGLPQLAPSYTNKHTLHDKILSKVIVVATWKMKKASKHTSIKIMDVLWICAILDSRVQKPVFLIQGLHICYKFTIVTLGNKNKLKYAEVYTFV